MTRFKDFTDIELTLLGIAVVTVSWQEFPAILPLVAEIDEELVARELIEQMQYRPQRGSLAESMACVVEVSNGEELLRILRAQLEPLPVSDYRIEPYIYDPRTGWETWVVLVNNEAVGFTDGPL